MAIELITGAPGNGKSLYTIWAVEKRRKEENREVYYNGIAELTLPWIQFDDPAKWYELPDGCIIVMDEAQKLFRPRALTKEVPQYVSALETHRHHGQDIYIVTQHPTLIETNVRRLCETHKHLMRKFGAKWSTIHAWKGVKDNCDKTRKDSQTTEFKYPKEVFTWYKSAEVHTVKMQMPKKVMLLLALPFVIALGVYFASTKLGGVSSAKETKPQTPQTGLQGSNGGGAVRSPTQTAESLYDSLQPRIKDLPWTAPRYDHLTQAVRAPVITGCVMTVQDIGKPTEAINGGFCLTQQGTKFWPSVAFLQSFHKNRMFIDFDPGPGIGETGQKQGQNQDKKMAGVPGMLPVTR